MMMNLVVILDLVLVMEVVGFYKNKTSFNIYKLNILTCMGRRCRSLVLQCYNSSISTYPMSEEQLKAFLEKVKCDTSLQEKLKAAADNDAVAAIAKDAGFSISADDLKNAQSEISEEELENVAGGACTSRLFSLPFEWAKPNSCNG